MACSSNYKAASGSLQIIDHNNITYVEPHRIIINNMLFLMFDEQELMICKSKKEKIYAKFIHNMILANNKLFCKV